MSHDFYISGYLPGISEYDFHKYMRYQGFSSRQLDALSFFVTAVIESKSAEVLEIVEKVNCLISEYVHEHFKHSGIHQWLIDQGIKDYDLCFDTSSFCRFRTSVPNIWLSFKDPRDAVAFKLAWVGL